ncbi:hypothetical protein ACR6C2_14400 [Streptomyces sp. INA 01156]
MTDTTRRPGDTPTGEAPTTTIHPTSRTTAPGTHDGLPGTCTATPAVTSTGGRPPRR